ADGENTNAPENITYASTATWSLIDTVNYYAAFNGGALTLTGTGTTSVLETAPPLNDRNYRSEEHTSELQSLAYLVCRLLHEKKNFDYIADLLIGPRTGQKKLPTRHVDSGTMWFYDPPPATEPLESDRHETRRGTQAKRLRPLALQWGGHLLMGQQGEEALQFVLASCVSTVCRVL